MKEYKLKMTRPEFLSVFINNGREIRSFEDIRKILPDYYDLIYCTYCAILEADIDKSDISYVSIGEENDVVIKLMDKKLPKMIRDCCQRSKVRLGEKIYKLDVRAKDKYLYVTAELTNPEVLSHTIIGIYITDDDD